MNTMSKSPVKVARVALKVGAKALPPYSHPKSPRRFTLPQLFGCLALKVFFKTDYRGIEQILRDFPNLCKELGLESVPHFTTLQKCERKILQTPRVAKLLESSIFFGAQKPSDKAYER
jgi:hypothetical protein